MRTIATLKQKRLKALSMGSALAISIGSLMLTTACTPTHHVRGNYLKDYQIAEVQPGQDGVSEVVRKLGSPTTQSTFDHRIWYYIGQETEKRGVFDAEVKEEQVVVVTFDNNNIVKSVEIADVDRNDLPYVKDKTPTSGTEVTVIQQLVGNLGKFNNNGGSSPSPTGGNP